MADIRVRYFAVLRERRGLSVEMIDTPAENVQQLYEDLFGRHDLRLPFGLVRFAVNGEFMPCDTKLRSGDEVALIPPVAGG